MRGIVRAETHRPLLRLIVGKLPLRSVTIKYSRECRILQSLPGWKAELILPGSDPPVPGSLAIPNPLLRRHTMMTTSRVWSAAHQTLGPPAFPFQLTDIPLEFKTPSETGTLHLLSVIPALSVAVPGGWKDIQPQTHESTVSPVESHWGRGRGDRCWQPGHGRKRAVTVRDSG